MSDAGTPETVKRLLEEKYNRSLEDEPTHEERLRAGWVMEAIRMADSHEEEAIGITSYIRAAVAAEREAILAEEGCGCEKHGFGSMRWTCAACIEARGTDA